MLSYAKTNLKLSCSGLEEHPTVDCIIQKLSNGKEIQTELKRQKVKMVQNMFNIELKVSIEATFRNQTSCRIQVYLKNGKILYTDYFIAISKRTQDIYPKDHLYLEALEVKGTRRIVRTTEDFQQISNVEDSKQISEEEIEKYFNEAFETQKKRKVEETSEEVSEYEPIQVTEVEKKILLVDFIETFQEEPQIEIPFAQSPLFEDLFALFDTEYVPFVETIFDEKVDKNFELFDEEFLKEV